MQLRFLSHCSHSHHHPSYCCYYYYHISLHLFLHPVLLVWSFWPLHSLVNTTLGWNLKGAHFVNEFSQQTKALCRKHTRTHKHTSQGATLESQHINTSINPTLYILISPEVKIPGHQIQSLVMFCTGPCVVPQHTPAVPHVPCVFSGACKQSVMNYILIWSPCLSSSFVQKNGDAWFGIIIFIQGIQ